MLVNRKTFSQPSFRGSSRSSPVLTPPATSFIKNALNILCMSIQKLLWIFTTGCVYVCVCICGMLVLNVLKENEAIYCLIFESIGLPRRVACHQFYFCFHKRTEICKHKLLWNIPTYLSEIKKK